MQIIVFDIQNSGNEIVLRSVSKCEEKSMTLLFLFRLILSDMEIIQEMWRELILLMYRAIRS